MGDGLARGFLELLGSFAKLLFATIAGSYVIVTVPLLLLWPKFDRGKGNRSLSRFLLIIFVSVVLGLAVINLFSRFLLEFRFGPR